MHTEEFMGPQFPVRYFLIRLLIVIVALLLLLFLFPKFYSYKVPRNNSDAISSMSKVYQANSEAMRKAAMDYYTIPVLPEGEVPVTVTLRELILKNYLLAFVDKDQKACDVDRSYVEVKKQDKGYLMKVYLKCPSEQNYTLSYFTV